MSFSRGEVVLLPLPFTDLTSRKVRPAVVVGFGGVAADLFLVPITSQLQNVEFAFLDWKSAGLNVACGIKAQIATVESRLIIKRVGARSTADWTAVQSRLRAWLQL